MYLGCKSSLKLWIPLKHDNKYIYINEGKIKYKRINIKYDIIYYL